MLRANVNILDILSTLEAQTNNDWKLKVFGIFIKMLSRTNSRLCYRRFVKNIIYSHQNQETKTIIRMMISI